MLAQLDDASLHPTEPSDFSSSRHLRQVSGGGAPPASECCRSSGPSTSYSPLRRPPLLSPPLWRSWRTRGRSCGARRRCRRSSPATRRRSSRSTLRRRLTTTTTTTTTTRKKRCRPQSEKVIESVKCPRRARALFCTIKVLSRILHLLTSSDASDC